MSKLQRRSSRVQRRRPRCRQFESFGRIIIIIIIIFFALYNENIIFAIENIF